MRKRRSTHSYSAASRAQELDINVVTPKGQTSYEVKRGAPKLELGEVG